MAAVEDIAPGRSKCVVVKRQRIALFNVDGQFYATDDTCTHAEASLSEGEVDGDQVECPLHGARFNVKTGAVLCMPAVVPVATYEVKVEDGAVHVKV